MSPNEPTIPPFRPRRIVIGANAHVELRSWLLVQCPELEIRGAKFTDVTADDLEWGEVYVGFKRPPVPTMGNIRWVHCTGAGVDVWTLPPALPDNILLTRSSESFGAMIAEWALARVFAFSQQLIDLAQAQRIHRWAPRDIARVAGTRAVVVGIGDVGGHVARLFAAAGCEVHGVSRTGRIGLHAPGDADVFRSVAEVSALRDMVQIADWLVVTVPLTPATHHLMSRDIMRACRGAFLLNAGRGAVVEEGAIVEALDQGWLRGAALDVFETEPLPLNSPLWGDARVIVSPHISGITTTDGAGRGFLECLASLERGERPRWTVDRQQGY